MVAMVQATFVQAPTGPSSRLRERSSELLSIVEMLEELHMRERQLEEELACAGTRQRDTVAHELELVRKRYESLMAEVSGTLVELWRLVRSEGDDPGDLEELSVIQVDVDPDDPEWICFQLAEDLQKTGVPGSELWLLDSKWLQDHIVGRNGTHEMLAKALRVGWRYQRDYVGKGRGMREFLADHPELSEATAFRYGRFVKRVLRYAVSFANTRGLKLKVAL